MTIINTRRFSLSIVPRFSFGCWNEAGIRVLDFGSLCFELVERTETDTTPD